MDLGNPARDQIWVANRILESFDPARMPVTSTGVLAVRLLAAYVHTRVATALDAAFLQVERPVDQWQGRVLVPPLVLADELVEA